MTEKHFISYGEKDIDTEYFNENTLKITFKTAQALDNYVFERAILTTGLIEEYFEIEQSK